MKYGVIDVGSNSVRLMIWEKGVTLFKTATITALGEGIAFSGLLQQESIDRTVCTINQFVLQAKESGADEVRIFATEAVRSAKNGCDFVDCVKAQCGIDVQVLTGDMEAKIGFYGAYSSGTCCVVDIGGASTEIIVGNKKRISYSKSVGIGVVKMKNVCNEDKALLDEYIAKSLKEYGEIPVADKLITIGGTAGTIVAISKKMKHYNPKIVHNSILSVEEISEVIETVASKPLSKRGEIVGLPENRADVILGGATLLLKILNMLGFKHCLVSEDDNLEGFAKKFLEK